MLATCADTYDAEVRQHPGSVYTQCAGIKFSPKANKPDEMVGFFILLILGLCCTLRDLRLNKEMASKRSFMQATAHKLKRAGQFTKEPRAEQDKERPIRREAYTQCMYWYYEVRLFAYQLGLLKIHKQQTKEYI
jgi:hypothetical protein